MAGVQGSNTILLCGTDLVSNPPATVRWFDNNGDIVTSDGIKFQLNQDSSSVSLLVRDLVRGDTGTWMCEIRVEKVEAIRHSIAVTVVGKEIRGHIISVEACPVSLLYFGTYIFTTPQHSCSHCIFHHI